eukprot:5970002-Amphidinium_carterae.2
MNSFDAKTRSTQCIPSWLEFVNNYAAPRARTKAAMGARLRTLLRGPNTCYPGTRSWGSVDQSALWPISASQTAASMSQCGTSTR